jgi:hypothetical protein
MLRKTKPQGQTIEANYGVFLPDGMTGDLDERLYRLIVTLIFIYNFL